MAPPPKFSFKMLVTPAMIFIARKFDLKNLENLQLARMIFITESVLMISLHVMVFFLLSGNKKKSVKIWVPPKPKPVLPFNMGPPAEIVKPEEYEETTYLDLEIKLLKESVQGILFGVGITLFMSFKFNVHVSLIIQSVSGPLNLLDSLVLKKYLLGIDQDRLYGEFLSQPTIEDIASLAIDDKEPQVVPLKEEAEVAKAPKSTGSKCAEVPVKTSVNEID